MLKNILSMADKPDQLGKYITAQMRELVGAHTVILLRHNDPSESASHTLLGVCPERRRGNDEVRTFIELADHSHILHAPTVVHHDDPASPFAHLFQGVSGKTSVIVPLEFSTTRVGLLLMIDILDTNNIGSVITSLDALSGVLALEIRNAGFYQILEATVVERTKELRESEERMRSAVANSPTPIMVFDEDGRILQLSKGWTNFSGYTIEDLPTLGDWLERAYGPRSDEVKEYIDKLYDITETVENGEWNVTAKDGSTRIWTFQTTPLGRVNRGKRVLLGQATDNTDRTLAEENLRRMEHQVRQSEKMEAVGQLAGGIAHDFNNVLGGIIGFTDISLNYVEKDSVIEQNLLKVLKAADRAKHLVKQILAFSRRGNPQKSVISLRLVINEVLDLLKSSIPSSVVIAASLSSEPIQVMADPTQMHQAILNLATNAVQAMNRKGTLTVRLDTVLLKTTQHGRSGEIVPGLYAVIEVSDTGYGMDAVTQAKAFEPFFTTKPVGEGTGMGLSVVLGIVQSHGGDIQVESRPGFGTTFRIFLPVHGEATSESKNDPTPLTYFGTERILFVDDEEMLADLAKSMLTPLGYKITCMTKSVEALEFIKRHKQDVDLLITDQTMPDLTGIELAQEVLKIRNDLPIIICSGYSKEINTEQAEIIGIARIIMKPYMVQEISKAVREVMDAKQP